MHRSLIQKTYGILFHYRACFQYFLCNSSPLQSAKLTPQPTTTIGGPQFDKITS